MEQLRRRSAERVNRQIACQDLGDRVKDWPIHILRGRENDFVQLIVLSFSQRQLTVDVLDHDNRAVDDDAEINGANGKQIGGTIVGVQNNKGKQKRERNRQSDNNG